MAMEEVHTEVITATGKTPPDSRGLGNSASTKEDTLSGKSRRAASKIGTPEEK
jgi:hypothetical protein